MAATTSTPYYPLETLHTVHGGSDGHQDPDTIVGIPFHGSCPRCHHFHINHQFTFSLDSTVHTRLSCECCGHKIFGLGRTSTQNTLASVESGFAFTPGVCVDRQDQQQPPALQVEMVPGNLGPGLLTPITERRSPSPSRSTSNVRPPTPSAFSLTGEQVTEEAGNSIREDEPIGSRAWPKRSIQGIPEEQVSRSRIVTLRRLRTIGRRFKRRFCAKPREWNFPRIGLQITYAHRLSITSHPSASASTTEVSSGQDRQDNARQQTDRREEDTEDRHASLRARRRELTLARERELALSRKCECSPECSCVGGSHVVQVDRPGTPENIHVPGFMFGHPGSSTASSNSQPSQNGGQEIALSHIGGHFESPRRSSSADESSSAAESGLRRIRFSQGSTLWSNGSSVSLRPRRPPVGRASSMPAGSRTQLSAGLRTGSQTSSQIPGSAWPEVAGASVSFDEGSMPGRITLRELSQDRHSSSRDSSSSPLNLRNPEENERLVNGVSSVSQIPVVDGDEGTMAPRTGIRTNGESDGDGGLPVGSDELSSALQDLTDRDMVDHGGHSPELLSDHQTD